MDDKSKNNKSTKQIVKKTVIVTPLMEANFAILSELIEARKNKNMSAEAKMKYDVAFMNAINKFSYIVDLHTNKYKKYSNYDDLKQEGMIGLTYALLNFKPERSKNFFKLANWYIKTKVKRSANKHLVVNIPMHVAKSAYIVSYNDIPNHDVSDFDMEDLYNKEQKLKFMAQSLHCLSAKQKQIIEMFYGFSLNKNNSIDCNKQKMPLSSIAKVIKMPRKDVEVELISARKLMAENLNNFLSS